MINSNSLRFVSWNVNGLRQCTQNGFQKFFRNIDADFFSVQITKMQEKDKQFSFNGYYEFWNDSEEENYAGTLIYTKYKPIDVIYGLPDGSYTGDGRIMTLEYADFFLVNCYVPKIRRTQEHIQLRVEFEDKVRNFYAELIKTKPVIINGDFNIVHTNKDTHLNVLDTTKSGYTQEERRKFEELLNVGLVDSFRYMNPFTQKYSTWSYQDNAQRLRKGQRSDLFLLNREIAPKVKNVDILTNVHGSNHCPIVLDVSYPFSIIYK